MLMMRAWLIYHAAALGLGREAEERRRRALKPCKYQSNDALHMTRRVKHSKSLRRTRGLLIRATT